MANDKTPETSPTAIPPRNLTIDDLETIATTMGTAITKGINEAQRRKVTIGEYMQRPNSLFSTKRPRLKRESYQNGYRLTSVMLKDEEIRLLNQITHSGRYLNRLVTVVVTDNGSGEEEVDIRFPCKSRDQQMFVKGEAKDFVDMLEKIVAVQKEEDELEEARKHPARPHFGKKMAEANASA